MYCWFPLQKEPIVRHLFYLTCKGDILYVFFFCVKGTFCRSPLFVSFYTCMGVFTTVCMLLLQTTVPQEQLNIIADVHRNVGLFFISYEFMGLFSHCPHTAGAKKCSARATEYIADVHTYLTFATPRCLPVLYCIYINEIIHTYIHTYILTYEHTYMHPQKHTYIHTYIHT